MKLGAVLTHPLVGVVTLPFSVWLWSLGGSQIGWGMTTNFCAFAFTLWTVLILLRIKLKIPRPIFTAGALYFAFLGTFTLLTYRPFFSIPTTVHLAEAIIGYGYLLGVLKGEGKSQFFWREGLFSVLGFLAIMAAMFLGSNFLPREDYPEQEGEEGGLTAAEMVGKQLSHGVCEGTEQPKLGTSPMDLEDFTYIIPYGLMVGGHVTPIDHQYFAPADRNSPRDAYKVYAMADADIVDIQSRAGSSGEEYRLVFSMSCTLFYYYDLVTSLAPDIKAAYDEFQSGQGDLKISVEEGQFIGRIGGRTLDFAVWDTDVTLTGFVVPKHYETELWKIHTADPLNYYTDDLKETLLARYIRTAEPVSGKIDHDIDGRLIGNWFLEGSGGYGGGGNEPYWKGHLAIAPDHIDPTTLIASFGDFGGEANQFTLEKDSPNPAEVSVETGLVKYNLVGYQYVEENGEVWDGESLAKNLERRPTTHTYGCAFFQLIEDRTLKMQTFPGEACSQISGFTNPAIYER